MFKDRFLFSKGKVLNIKKKKSVERTQFKKDFKITFKKSLQV